MSPDEPELWSWCSEEQSSEDKHLWPARHKECIWTEYNLRNCPSSSGTWYDSGHNYSCTTSMLPEESMFYSFSFNHCHYWKVYLELNKFICSQSRSAKNVSDCLLWHLHHGTQGQNFIAIVVNKEENLQQWVMHQRFLEHLQ